MKCNLCNSTNVKLFYTQKYNNKTYHYIYCKNCDLYQIRDIIDNISPKYTEKNIDINENTIWHQGEHKQKAYYKYFDLINEHYNNNINNFSLLDIGCGTAGFFDYIQEKTINLYGFDASSAQAKYASQKYPLVKKATSIKKYLKLLNEPDLKFNLITLWDVVEHIPNPLELFSDIKNYLSDDGLCFISIPNGGALKKKILLYKLLFRNISLDPEEHVFYYTPKSIKYYLNKCGLNAIDIGTVPFYENKLSIYEICRRTMHILSSTNIDKAPQIYILAKKK